MIFEREIGEKGQVVIPKDIREYLNLHPKEKILFEIKGDEVVIRKEGDPEEFLKDFLNVPGKEKKGSIKEIKKTILEQYDEEIS
ncbi:AbrB/MazE/SpoVT family DNA-binding domain-containing protein [Candidatus Pacearchaeota archaeon]|nr:AbrB/MazE/SpoVT family DNA-binding domain-containing protein [Candidatus Pacearchaeota archaeon]